MMGIEPLSGAYGRVYTALAAVQKDFNEGKDFKTVGGPYCSCRDFADNQSIRVRYGRRLEKTGFVKRSGKND